MEIVKNNKVFWRFIKDKRRGESGVPARMYLDGREAENDSETANLFADSLYQFLTIVFPFRYPMALLEIKISLVILILQRQKLKK